MGRKHSRVSIVSFFLGSLVTVTLPMWAVACECKACVNWECIRSTPTWECFPTLKGSVLSRASPDLNFTTNFSFVSGWVCAAWKVKIKQFCMLQDDRTMVSAQLKAKRKRKAQEAKEARKAEKEGKVRTASSIRARL